MPYHEEHCQDSLRKYGKRFDDLHRWMDEPAGISGREHRMFRHDPKTTPQEARKLFGEFADHACLDHIMLDQQSSEEIRTRKMDIEFCPNWEGDENSKHCRKCAHPGEPCYELWRMVLELATTRRVFVNNKPGRGFGNRYRIESPHDEYCYLQMLQGAESRFQLPMEDFLYVTRTGRGGINETPSGTRQYPFVDLLLEIVAEELEGASLIEEVKGQDPLYESMHDYDDDTISGDGLLGPDDSHFYGSLNASEKTKATRSASPKSSTVNNTSSPDLLSILKKASVPVAVSFFLAYFVLSLFSAGIFITLLAFMVSVLTVGIGLTAEKRYSIAGGYYWSEREGTTGEKIFVFLFCFLLITVFFLDGVPINARFCLFATGLAALVIIVHRSWTSGAL